MEKAHRKKTIMSDNNYDMFAGNKSVEEIRIEESKKILMEYGYRVIEPLEINKDVNDIPDLRRYFYAKLWNKYPDRMQYYIQYYKEELKIVRELIKSREENTNRKTAIQECVAIIDAVFDHEEEFNFDRPITNISILRMGWVINLAISILNLKKDKEKEIIRDKMMEEIEDQYMRDRYKVDLKARSKKLDRILTKMEEDNAKS